MSISRVYWVHDGTCNDEEKHFLFIRNCYYYLHAQLSLRRVLIRMLVRSRGLCSTKRSFTALSMKMRRRRLMPAESVHICQDTYTLYDGTTLCHSLHRRHHRHYHSLKHFPRVAKMFFFITFEASKFSIWHIRAYMVSSTSTLECVTMVGTTSALHATWLFRMPFMLRILFAIGIGAPMCGCVRVDIVWNGGCVFVWIIVIARCTLKGRIIE